MKPQFTYFAKVKNGGLPALDKAKFKRELATFEGCTIRIRVDESKPIRSLEANNFLFGCVYRNALEGFKEVSTEYNGLSISDIHEYFKQKYSYLLPVKKTELVDIETGEIITIEKHTTKASNLLFVPYTEEVIRFCIEFLNIPSKFFDTDWYKETKQRYYARKVAKSST